MPSSYTIGAHYEAFVREMVESGRYASASEVLRDGLRLMEEREQLRAIKLDALRQAIAEGLDPDSIDIHVDGHTVTLEGSVETIGMARKVELGALSVDGVRHIRNRLETTGVDSHIPNED